MSPKKFNFRPRGGELFKGLGKVLGILFRPRMAPFTILFIIAVVVYSMCLVYVRPNEFGIKEVQIGINKGIQETVYPAGYSFVIPNMHIMHRLPKNLQVLEMTGSSTQNYHTAAAPSDDVRYEHAAKIQTSDGFYVDVDVSILYRIFDPYTVMVKLGPGEAFYEQGIRPKAEAILKQALGELTTEEFYDSPKRVDRSQLAQELLDREMQDFGIEVHQVLIRYFIYSERIQQNIEEKKLQDQLVMTNESQRKAATKEQELNKVMQQGEMQVKITIQEGDSYKVMKEAEKDLYVRKKTASADLLVELAEAKSTEMKNVALQEIGVDRKIAMELAEVLDGLNAIVIPVTGEGALNPLDLNEVMETFGVQSYDEKNVSTNMDSILPEDFLESAIKDSSKAVSVNKEDREKPADNRLAGPDWRPEIEGKDVSLNEDNVETTEEELVQ